MMPTVKGTDVRSLVSLLTDGDFVLESLNQTLFPGVPTNVKALNMFQAIHSRLALLSLHSPLVLTYGIPSSSAERVLAAVQKARIATGSNDVVITGHSVGAAVALIDALYLPLHLPNITITTSVFGLPRVGNLDFAKYGMF